MVRDPGRGRPGEVTAGAGSISSLPTVAAPAPPPRDGASTAVESAVRGLFGRDSVYMVLWVLQLVGAAVVTPVITRLIPLGEYGWVASANAVMQVVFVLAGCGLQLAIQRRYAESGGAQAAARLLGFSVLVAGLVATLVILTSGLWRHALGFPGSGLIVEMAGVWAGTSAVTACCLALLRSQDRLVAFGSVSLVQSVVAEVTSLVLVRFVAHTAGLFVLGQALAQAVACVLGLVLVRPVMVRRHDRVLIGGALRFGLPLVPAALGGVLLNTVDKLMVQGYLGSESVARYAIASNIGDIPLLVLGALDAMWLPRVFALEDESERAVVLETSRDALFRLLAPVLVGLAVGAPLVLEVWAPGQYRTADLVLPTTVIALSAIPYTAALSSRRELLSRSATGTIAVAALVAAAVNIGLDLLLLPRIGIIGAAVSMVVAYAVQEALQRVRGRRAPRGPSGRGLVMAVAAGALAFGSCFVPMAGGAAAVRVVIAGACVGWFGAVLLRVAAPGWMRARLTPSGR